MFYLLKLVLSAHIHPIKNPNAINIIQNTKNNIILKKIVITMLENGGIMDSRYPETPKATRDYWGVTLSLEKRFCNNWQGGISYTWSSLRGNYSGLASSDEPDRANDSSYKKPRSVDFIDELPKNNYGKIMKKDLRVKYWRSGER